MKDLNSLLPEKKCYCYVCSTSTRNSDVCRRCSSSLNTEEYVIRNAVIDEMYQKILQAKSEKLELLQRLDDLSDLIFLKLLIYFPNANKEILVLSSINLNEAICSKYGTSPKQEEVKSLTPAEINYAKSLSQYKPKPPQVESEKEDSLENNQDWKDLQEILKDGEASFDSAKKLGYSRYEWLALKVIQCCFTRRPAVKVDTEAFAKFIFHRIVSNLIKWDDVPSDLKEVYLSDADAIINFLEGGK